MWLELALRDERIAGRAEGRAEGELFGLAQGVLDLQQDLGEVSEELRARILSVRDVEVLQKLLKIAARADSIEAFKEMSEQL